MPPSSAVNSRPSSSLGNRSSISSIGAVAGSSVVPKPAVRGSHSPMGSRLPVKKPTTSVSRSQTSSASSSRAASPRKSESPSTRRTPVASRVVQTRPQIGAKTSITPKPGPKEKAAEEELESSNQTTKDIVQKRRKMFE